MPETPNITEVCPAAAMPGGEVQLAGSGLGPTRTSLPTAQIGDEPALVTLSRNSRLSLRVPFQAEDGLLVIDNNGRRSNARPIAVASLVATDMNPVASPVADRNGNLYVAYSGPRGERTPVSVYRIGLDGVAQPYVRGILNATGLAMDPDSNLYVSSRHEGTIYRVRPNGEKSVYAEGMGVATGLAMDAANNLYCGDRSGSIFKIAPDRQIFVYATLEPSVAAYHLAASPEGRLYVTAPTISCYDSVFTTDHTGTVKTYFAGLGRPQGVALRDGELYVAASLHGQRGIVRISPDGSARLVVAGSGIVGLCWMPDGDMALVTNAAVFRLGAAAFRP